MFSNLRQKPLLPPLPHNIRLEERQQKMSTNCTIDDKVVLEPTDNEKINLEHVVEDKIYERNLNFTRGWCCFEDGNQTHNELVFV